MRLIVTVLTVLTVLTPVLTYSSVDLSKDRILNGKQWETKNHCTEFYIAFNRKLIPY